MLDDLIGGSRWRPVVAAVAVIVIGTTVFFSVAGGSSPSRLPAPPHVVSAARSNQHTTQATQPDTFTPLQSPSLTSCSASVSNSAPAQGATAETVTVTSAAGAQVRVEADYARTHSVHTTTADPTGKASVSLPIDHASPGVTVPVKVTASLAHTKVTCGSSFTPVGTLLGAQTSLAPLTLFPAVTKLLPGAPTLKQLPALPPPTITTPTPPPSSPPPVSPPAPAPPPPPPPTTTTTTTTTVPPTTTTTTTVPPTTTTTTTVPPTTTTTTTVPPTTTTTTTVPPTTTTVPPTTTTTTLILGL